MVTFTEVVVIVVVIIVVAILITFSIYARKIGVRRFCPNCGLRQLGWSYQCPRCGVVFKEWKE